MTEQAELRAIPGYEGLYSVTADGRVWSHPKRIGRRMHAGMWLRPGTKAGGYQHVVLRKPGESKVMKVHRAVALSWVPNPASLPVVNHKDGNPRNNDMGNLEWCTQAQNLQHAHDTGLNPTRARIADTGPVVAALQSGAHVNDVAAAFGISVGTVYDIKAGRHRPALRNRLSTTTPKEGNHAL